MSSDRFIRQRDIIPPEKLAALKVTIIGAGAVGSFTCLTLTKMGVTDITVYDEDTVEEHNLPNQWYRSRDLGRRKVDALTEIILDFTDVTLTTRPRNYTHEPLSGIVICAVDSMDSRLLIWREVKKFKPELYIDARMGAEVGKIHVIRPADLASRRHYEEDLYPSSEAFHAPCTAKATVYCAAGLGAFAGVALVNWMRSQTSPELTVDFSNQIILNRWTTSC